MYQFIRNSLIGDLMLSIVRCFPKLCNLADFWPLESVAGRKALSHRFLPAYSAAMASAYPKDRVAGHLMVSRVSGFGGDIGPCSQVSSVSMGAFSLLRHSE